MPRRSIVRCAFVFALALSSTVHIGIAQSSPPSPPLSLEDIVKESQTGIPEDLIITKIRKNGRAFNLSADEMHALSDAGVSAMVVKYLLDPSQPYSPAPPPSPPPST